MLTEIRTLKTEADYDAALKEIERYFNDQPEPGTPEGDRFDLLALVIEDYERKHWPIEEPDPVEAIKFRMEQAGYGQTDFAKLIGSKSRASEILNRKRHLTLEAIWKLSRAWNIPAESLVKPYELHVRKGHALVVAKLRSKAKGRVKAHRATRKAGRKSSHSRVHA